MVYAVLEGVRDRIRMRRGSEGRIGMRTCICFFPQLSIRETGISGCTDLASWARPPSFGWLKRTSSRVAILREHQRGKDGMTDSTH